MVEHGVLSRNQMIADDIIKTFLKKRVPYLEEQLVFEKFLRKFTFDAGNTVNILRSLESMEAVLISEGAEIPSQFDKSESFELTTNKYGITAAVTNESIEDARWDVLGDALKDAAKGMARKRNKVVGDALLAGGISGTVGDVSSWYTTETPPTFGSNNFTVLGHTTHLFNLSGALTVAAIRDGIQHIAHHGFRPSAMLINSAQINTLMGLLPAGGAGQGYIPDKVYEEWFRTGKPVGDLYGLMILQNDYIPKGTLLIVDSAVKPIAFAQKRRVTQKKFEDARKDIQGATFTERFGAKTIEKGAGYIIYGIT